MKFSNTHSYACNEGTSSDVLECAWNNGVSASESVCPNPIARCHLSPLSDTNMAWDRGLPLTTWWKFEGGVQCLRASGRGDLSHPKWVVEHHRVAFCFGFKSGRRSESHYRLWSSGSSHAKNWAGGRPLGVLAAFLVSPRAAHMCSATLLPQSEVVNGVSFVR